MTVTSFDVRDEYTGTAAQTVFNYTFLIFSSSDLNVYITPLGQIANDLTDITTAYTVDTGTIGNPSGGFITLNSGVSAGDLITIVSGIDEDRTTDYQNSGDFLPNVVNDDFDRVVSIVKQIGDRSGRSLAFPESQQDASSLDMPSPEAGLYVRWRDDETGLENVGPGDLSSDAGSITYTAQPANSTQRTVQARLSDFITPKDFNAVGDGVTDDTAAFSTMGVSTAGKTIDLLGLTYFVTAIPLLNRFIHGYFLLTNLDESAPISIPAHETLDRYSLKIDTGNRYSSWPQDSCSEFNGQILIAYNEGSHHTADDIHVIVATSVDKGKSITSREKASGSVLGSRASFSGANVLGQDLMVIENGENTIERLYGLRRYEVAEVTDLIESTNTSGIFKYIGEAGVKINDRITISGADNVGGIDCNGTHDITGITNLTSCTFVPGGTATSSEVGGGTFRIEFLQDDFVEIQPDSLTMGQAIVAADSNITAAPTLIHSMVHKSNDTGASLYPTIYMGYHGGTDNADASIVKVIKTLQSTPEVEYAKPISSTLVEGVEPTVTFDAASDSIMGFVRSEGTGYPIRFWHSTDDLDTDATVVDSPWGNSFGLKSPIPCRVIGSELHYCLTGTRVRDGLAGSVGLYWGRVPLASLPADIWTDSTLVKIKDLFFSNTNASDSTNAVGVASISVVDDNTISFIYANEASPLVDDFDGQPYIECMTIKINGDDAFSSVDDGTTIETYTEKTENLNVNTITSASTFRFSGHFESNGATNLSNGIDVVRNSAGKYSATFRDDKGAALDLGTRSYWPFIQVLGATGDVSGAGITSGFTSTGFDYEIRNQSANALEDHAHLMGVILIEDFAREDWV